MPIEQDEMFPEGASSSTWETEEVSKMILIERELFNLQILSGFYF